MPDVAALGLPADYIVVRATIDELEIIDASNPDLGILASVKNQRLGFERMALEEAIGGMGGRWGRVVIRWER
jgi:hypothetical protein